MKSFPKPLTAEEEAYYLSRFREGDMDAKRILIERNLRLVAHVARKYVNQGEETEDLIAVGTVGLSRGLTSVLNTPAKWIVIFTMYIGRIGPLTLGAAVVSRAQKKPENVHLAEENIMIG